MRPQNEWFKPEQLRRYYFAYESLTLSLVLVLVGALAVTGILTAMQPWVLAVGGTMLLLGFGYVMWWIPAFYRTADYRFTDDEVEYRRGVFFQQQTTVPYNRITNVGTSQGPIQRLVNAGSVGIHTAGYGGQTGAELTIGGVTDFPEIQAQILGWVRERPATATESEDAVDTISSRPARADETDEMLSELRRIRELLEKARFA
ncbi:PH domain-containing protein [Halomicroarcula sp. GCM10025324]|uniref:PH domain-containing protein n=1 Tax=Haloarcula TaxID=2237 RepID=UPI0023E7BF98|nr:PH domain-containing protein [Halomicroarcula sp. ZS-22-S1]